MYVTLLSDVEDIITPEADDLTRIVAELVEREGTRATFCVVGERARQWRERGRTDVIAALMRHDVGYHTMRHSVHPTIVEYLQDRGWADGVAEVIRREGPGVEELAATFGQLPSCYGGPGNSWGPQVNEAMVRLGVPAVVYAYTRVPRGDVHRFCGATCYPNGINVQDGEYHHTAEWEKDMARLTAFLSRAISEGTQWVEVYIGHPSRILHEEFWDGPNFTRGRNPPRSRWIAPRRKTDADLAKALDNCAETVHEITALPGVQVRTIRQMNELFARAVEEELSAAEIEEVAAVIDGNLERMVRWVILPEETDSREIRRLTRERLTTLRRLKLVDDRA